MGAHSSIKIIKNEGYKWIDYDIEYLSYHINQVSLPVSNLIWSLLVKCEQSRDYTCYSRQEKARVYYYNVGNSAFLNILSSHQWVPQVHPNNDTLQFVAPKEADSKLLPDGFTFDNGWSWLTKTSFGSIVKLREELQRQEAIKNDKEAQQIDLAAKRMGFSSLAEAQEVAEAKRIDPQGYARWLAGTHKPEFPQKESVDPNRRSQKIEDGMADAQQKAYEQRPRSTRITGNTADVEKYLRLSYENDDGLLICQICKDVMPFKKRNDEYYMEKVEVFTKEYLNKEHHSHYLAMCPLCSAKYREFVKTDSNQMDSIRDSLMQNDWHEILIQLDEETTIKFVETHYTDLRDSMIGESTENDSM